MYSLSMKIARSWKGVLIGDFLLFLLLILYLRNIGINFAIALALAELACALIFVLVTVCVPHVRRAIRKEQWYLAGMFILAILIGLIFEQILEMGQDTKLIPYFAGAVLPIALLISSVMVSLTQAFLRKKGVAPFLYPVILIVFAVFYSSVVYFNLHFFYWSLSFLIVGVFFFFYTLFVIIREETLGATLPERITYELRKKTVAVSFEESPITGKVFPAHVKVDKGNAILVLCDCIEEGRRIAGKIIRSGNYGIYITADRPWTIIKEKFSKDYLKAAKNLYCIDCFTNFYGLDEFKEAEKGEIAPNFCPYTPRPVTIRELHGALRDIRKRIVFRILCQEKNWDYRLYGERNFWSKLKKDERDAIEKELASGRREGEENVKIIYDSVSALASIFEIEDLLKFLIHDTNLDKAIGRNTLLLVKEGVFENDIIARLETFCEITLKPKIKNGKLHIEINKIRDEKPPEKFSIDC